MSEKHILVQGAVCKCQFGTVPDKLKVLSHTKEYANDKDASKKLIGTTKETGAATFEKNTFGNCAKMNNNPCKVLVTEWKGFYEEVILNNGGKILTEDSKAICAIAGTPCIEIVNHGQITEPGEQNFKNANEDIQSQINPLVDVSDMTNEQPADTSAEDASKK